MAKKYRKVFDIFQHNRSNGLYFCLTTRRTEKDARQTAYDAYKQFKEFGVKTTKEDWYLHERTIRDPKALTGNRSMESRKSKKGMIPALTNEKGK